MPLSKKINWGIGGIHGNCWFAAEDIAAGEPLWWPGPLSPHDVHIKISDLLTWPAEKITEFMHMAYQVDEETMAGLNDNRSLYDPAYAKLTFFHGEFFHAPCHETTEHGLSMPFVSYIAENYVNHSCDGNAWYENGGERLVAMRDIKKGEEICYDYALHAAHPVFRLECGCGKPNCRKLVTGDDWRQPEIQQRYGDHFLEHVQEKIKALNNH